MIERICEYCGKEFKAFKCHIKRGGGKYCSEECSHRARRAERVKTNCKHCGKEFKIRITDIERNRGKYCSRECQIKEITKKLYSMNSNRFRFYDISNEEYEDILSKEISRLNKKGFQINDEVLDYIRKVKLDFTKLKYELWQYRYRKSSNTIMLAYKTCSCGNMMCITSEKCKDCINKNSFKNRYKDWQFWKRKDGTKILVYDRCPQCGSIKRISSKLCKKCHVNNIIMEKRKDGKGYIRHKIKDEEGNNKWKAEHILIAEKVLGRELKDNEVVHHINMKKYDNRHENLLICSKEYHAWLHSRYALRFAELHLQ